ncbi:MAG: pyruvate synthase subunit beta [Planctomycetes bacterium]|nr:pyruvate synthase subunit beta [Planctomycetota bacterium]
MKNYSKPVLDGRRIWTTPEKEIYSSGHLACPGCGVAISARTALKVFGKKTILVVPACCFAVIDGPFPYSAAGVPLLHCAFESAAATASGVRAALDQMKINDINVVAWAGDGGTYDIGLQALSAAAERNENMIYVCYDNEAYMNTGIQRSSATPAGAWTTTTPAYPGKPERKKDLASIMIAHKIPYFATASISYMNDFIDKFRKAKDIKGFRFIHLLSPCAPGWKHAESDTIELGFLAVRSRIFPLFEVENNKWKITYNPHPTSINKYLDLQGRFKHVKGEDIKAIQTEVDKRWEELCEKCDLPSQINPPEQPVQHTRNQVLSKEQFQEVLSKHFINFSDNENELAYQMLKSLWLDKSYSHFSDEELICNIIARVQMCDCT